MRRRHRRRYRRNPPRVHDLFWTIAVSVLTAATSAIVVYYVNKKLNQTNQQQQAVVGKGNLYPAPQTTSAGQWA